MMILNSQRKNVFQIEHLPLLARLHRNCFRSGNMKSSGLQRILTRLMFYPMLKISRQPIRGKISVNIGKEKRIAHFDARNRQFSALYFDVFSTGYEPEFTTIIDALVPDDAVLYDIGSNWGFFAIYLASRPEFKGHVHAFEPWPKTHLDLVQLVKELKLSNSITCHKTALSDTSGHANMCSPSHSGLAHLSDKNHSTSIESVKLDDIDLNPPKIIKIDAEGSEENIIQGGQRFLSEHHPMLIFENRAQRFGDDECVAVLIILEKIGYQLYAPRLVLSSKENHQVELIKINAETRRNYSECPNLFACHISDMNQLRTAIIIENE
jgi:FkbM family methyltransferase